MLFVNRWIMSLLVALVVLDGGVQAYRYYQKMGHRFRPVMMKPMPVGRFGFVRAENPNADEASGEKTPESVPQHQPTMDVMAGHELHEPMMREMIHDSPHPVEIDMGPGMQSRVMGFEGELDGEGNFGRAAEDGEENEEGGAQFRHFKHKHKKHKHVIHEHHHYHHKKEGHGHGYGDHGYGKHHGYGHHGHGGGHGYHDDDGDDYEPTYGHHGRYRRSSMDELSPTEGQTPDAQALDRTALTHSSPDIRPIPMEPSLDEPGPPTVYRQSVSRRQLVRSKNERLAQLGRDRAQRANSPHESVVRAVRNLVFDRYNPRIMEPFGGKKPTDNATDRRRQRQDVRRRMQSKPQTRPIDAFKNAITSIRQRVMPTTTTPVPTTVANKRQRAGRVRRTKTGRSSAGMVAAPLATPAPVPPAPVPAPIDCAECRRLCNVRGRARSRPLNEARRAGTGAMVASNAAADEGIVASAGPAAGAPFGNIWNNLFGNLNSDGMVASAGPEGQGSKMWDNFVQFFAMPESGMVASAKDQDASAWNFWNMFAPLQDENVGAARKGGEILPICEDISG